MEENLSQESDISFNSAQSQSSSSEEEHFDDAVENGDWQEAPSDMVFNEFDSTNSGPKHDLNNTASPLNYFSLFWTVQLLQIVILETNR